MIEFVLSNVSVSWAGIGVCYKLLVLITVDPICLTYLYFAQL